MSSKILKIIREALPILIMIGLIPIIKSDYFLAIVYVAIITICLMLKKEKGDFELLIFAALIMTGFESMFVKTGVEYFIRNTLFGAMPLWLPILWGYGFVAIKRGIKILNY